MESFTGRNVLIVELITCLLIQKTEIRPLKQADMETVVELLQSNSIYRPNSEDFDIIWQKFSQQQNLHVFVVTKNDIVVGYGCLFVEVKIRGGTRGHIEDIVTDQNYRRIELESAW